MCHLATLFLVLSAGLSLGFATPITPFSSSPTTAPTNIVSDLGSPSVFNQSTATLSVTTLLPAAGVLEHEPTTCFPPSATRAAASAQTETSSGSMADTTVVSIVGILILFILIVVAYSCLGYGRLRERWWSQVRNWFRRGTPPGPAVTGGMVLQPVYHLPAYPPQVHPPNGNVPAPPPEMRRVTPIPLIVSPRFG